MFIFWMDAWPCRENLFKMINELPTVTDVVDQFVTTNEELKFREGFKNKHFTTVTEAEATRLVAAATVEEVFKDFAGRRAAIVKALTTGILKEKKYILGP